MVPAPAAAAPSHNTAAANPCVTALRISGLPTPAAKPRLRATEPPRTSAQTGPAAMGPGDYVVPPGQVQAKSGSGRSPPPAAQRQQAAHAQQAQRRRLGDGGRADQVEFPPADVPVL